MFVPMFTLRIENTKGESFELTNSTRNYVVTDVSGLLRPPTDVRTSEISSDGDFYNSSRMQKRNIVITLRLMGDIETNRQQLYRIFPAKTDCTVYYKNRNRDVRIVGYVEMLDGSIFTDKEEVQISIICPKPWFESLHTLQTELSRIAKMFEFPFSIQIGDPIPISEVRDLSLCTLVNSGDTECGCIIKVEFLGLVSNLKIFSVAKQQFFGINWTFQENDILTINTRSGKEKGVYLLRDGVTTNFLHLVMAGSRWFQLAVGQNDFTFTANNPENVKILFAAVELFGGI